MEELVSEENMSLSFGKIAKAVSSLISHLDENDSKNYIVTFDSGDTANPTAWKNVATLTSKEKHSSLFSKISTMFNNVRYLYKILGTTDISTLGTVTQAISTIKGNIGDMKGISSSAAITTQGQYALDAREKNASVEGTLANELSKVNSNFQAGVDSIYNAIVAQGTTPSSKSLSDVTSGITNLSNNKYNNGYSNGVSDADNRANPDSNNYRTAAARAFSMIIEAINSYNNYVSANPSHRTKMLFVNVGFAAHFQDYFGSFSGSMKNGTLDGTISYSGYRYFDTGCAGSFTIVKWGSASGLGNGGVLAVEKGIAAITADANLGGTYTKHVLFFVVY